MNSKAKRNGHIIETLLLQTVHSQSPPLMRHPDGYIIFVIRYCEILVTQWSTSYSHHRSPNRCILIMKAFLTNSDVCISRKGSVDMMEVLLFRDHLLWIPSAKWTVPPTKLMKQTARYEIYQLQESAESRLEIGEYCGDFDFNNRWYFTVEETPSSSTSWSRTGCRPLMYNYPENCNYRLLT